MPKVICDLYDFFMFLKVKDDSYSHKVWINLIRKNTVQALGQWNSITIQILIYSKMCVCVGGRALGKKQELLYSKCGHFIVLNYAKGLYNLQS